MLAHFGHARITPAERERSRRVAKVIGEADPVIREYRKLDGALRVYFERKR